MLNYTLMLQTWEKISKQIIVHPCRIVLSAFKETPSGPFRYFMVLVDAFTRWSHVCLLSTLNLAFARLLAQNIKLQAHFPDHPIKTIRLDNAGEFFFFPKAFHDYCMSLGIYVGFHSTSIIQYLEGIFLLLVLQIVILMNLFSRH